MGRRPPCCDKAHVKKGPWTAEEDAKILAYVASHGIGNWTLVPQKAGLNRCGKSCRLRWTNYLRPDLKHDSFTPHEEELILRYHQAIGSRWSLIAKQLPGRTDNDVKNHWNTKLKKKLFKMGIDPITHKPFGQLLSDYGNIGEVLPRNPRNQCNNNVNVPEISMLRTHEHSDFSNVVSNLTTIDQLQENNLTFLTSNYDNYNCNNNLDAHFQLINEAASSSTSSPPSPSSLTQASDVQANLPSSPSIWSDYLVADQEHQCTNDSDQGNVSTESPQMHDFVDDKNVISYTGFGVNRTKSILEAATTSVSFVEAILNRDRQMQVDFPQLLDGYSEY